jgi:hypothetical protein
MHAAAFEGRTRTSGREVQDDEKYDRQPSEDDD